MAAQAKATRKIRFASPTDTRTSFSLTPDTLAVLERLQQDLKDGLGRSVGMSAVLRALLRHVGQQKDIASILDSLISAELAAGVQWGKLKRRQKR